MSAVLAERASRQTLVPLAEVVDFNPKPARGSYADDLEVSFVPMAAVEAGSGRMDPSDVRTYGLVKKGFTHFCEGDVLFAKITPCMENGKMAVATGLRNGIGFGSTEFHVLRPRSGLEAKYLYHYVSAATYRREAAHHMTGAVGQKRVPLSFLESSEIPLPSVSEQRRVVAEIEKQFSRLDEAVANLQRVKANLKRYQSSMLAEAFAGSLVPLESTLSSATDKPFESGGDLVMRIARLRGVEGSRPPRHEVPQGWAMSCLGECFDVIVGATPSRKEAAYWGGGIPWVSSGEVQFGRIRETEESISDLGLQNSSTKVNPAGSVLLGMIGQGRTRGQAALLDIDAANNQNCAAIWVSRTPIPPEFVFYWLMHRYQETRGEGSGNNQQALNKRLVQAIPIPVPPLAEQRRIVAELDRRLSIVRGVEAEVDANLKRAQALRQAILARAFSA